MKTPIKELIDSVGNMAQGLDADELYDYFMEKATQMLEKEKEMLAAVWLDAQVAHQGDAYIKPSDPTFDEYYNETFNIK